MRSETPSRTKQRSSVAFTRDLRITIILVTGNPMQQHISGKHAVCSAFVSQVRGDAVMLHLALYLSRDMYSHLKIYFLFPNPAPNLHHLPLHPRHAKLRRRSHIQTIWEA